MHRHLWGVRLYPVFILLGIVLGVIVAAASARAAGLDRKAYWRLQLTVVLAGLFGAKIYALIEQGAFVSLAWEATRAYRYPGGIIAVLLVLPVAHRFLLPGIGLAQLGDIFAPSVGFAMAVVRLGCFFNGCCYGHISDVPWATVFPRESPAWAAHIGEGVLSKDATASLPVHPLQLYFAGLSLATGASLIWFEKHKRYAGQVLLLLLVLLSGGQFLLEFLRAERALHVQIASLVLALVGASGLVLGRRHVVSARTQ